MKHVIKDVLHELDDILAYQAEYLRTHVDNIDESDLTWRPGQYRWNILEVIEHLNRFGEHYLPRLADIIDAPRHFKQSDIYNSGWIGEFFMKQTRPVNGVVPNKAKSPSRVNPFLRELDRSVIYEYKDQVERLRGMLQKLDSINLSKNRIPVLALGMLKLNLGDSLRFLTYHAERHFVQLDNLVHKRRD